MSLYQLAWHVHHIILIELLLEPMEIRIEYIRASKPSAEVETRVRLLKPVRGPLPDGVEEARQEFAKVHHARQRAATTDPFSERTTRLTQRLWFAEDKLAEVLDKYWPDIELLHEAECPNCPWNGETIFPEQED